MPAKAIRLFGDPVLRARAAEVVDFDRELRNLLRDLWDTMEQAQGAGLAAPQLGVGLRAFTYHCDGAAGHLVNPSFEVVGEQTQDGPEGCLSIPGLAFDCRRHEHIVARGRNGYADPVEIVGSQQLARCVQHEIDHLDGVLFVDRLDPETRRQAMAEIRRASWFDEPAPLVKTSPHPMFGKAR